MMKKIKNGTWLGLSLAIIFSVLWYPVKANADQIQDYVTTHIPDNNAAIVHFFDQFSSIVAPTGFWAFVGRSISWWVIDLLVKLVNVLTGVFAEIVSLLPFYSSEGVSNLLSDFTVLQKAFATLIIIGLGIMMFFIGRKANIGETIVNLLCVFLILGFLTFGMSKATDIVTAYVNGGSTYTPSGQQEVGGEEPDPGFAPGNETVLANVSDVYAFAVDDFENPNLEKKNFVTDYKTINPLETIDPEMIKTYSPEKGAYFEKKLKSIPKADGTIQEIAVDTTELPKLLKPLTPLMGDTYYRYVYNSWTIIITLVITALVLVLTSYKGAGLIIDIAWNFMFANIIGFLDIRTLSRFKKVIESIFTSIGVFLIIPALISLYGLFNAFIAASGISVVAQIICLVAAGYFVINGPEQVVRVLGIDAGVKDGWNLIGGALGLSKMGKSATNIAAGAAEKAAGVGGFIAGYIANGNTPETSPEDDGLYKDEENEEKETDNGSLYDDQTDQNENATDDMDEENQDGVPSGSEADQNGITENQELGENENADESNTSSPESNQENDPDSLYANEEPSTKEDSGSNGEGAENQADKPTMVHDAENESQEPAPKLEENSATEQGASSTPTNNNSKSPSRNQTSKNEGESSTKPTSTDNLETQNGNTAREPSIQGWTKDKMHNNRYTKTAKKGYTVGKGTKQSQINRKERKQRAKNPIDKDLK